MSRNINLLAWREARRVKRTRMFYITMLLSGALGAGLGGAVAYGYQKTLVAQQQRNAHIVAHIAHFDDGIAQAERYQKEVTHLDQQLARFKHLLMARTDTLCLFNDLAASLADGVTYRHLERRHNQINITAVAQNEHQVSEQLRRLAEQPGLDAPVLSEVTSGPEGQRNFTLEIAQARSSSLLADKEGPP
ncbi:PilN domain-containing protein [Vreelandella populi]|uniref:PilN domain-containing protein n=1 Tax=Vreelandella populi TaxID=2498858 RepID=UPI000F8E724F|nr:PilN domain-containing protein [Halomonas populi]RUR52984.1 fimbrial assembly protein [Halomonas populi]